MFILNIKRTYIKKSIQNPHSHTQATPRLGLGVGVLLLRGLF